MLSTTQIYRALKNHPWSSKLVTGVFPADKIPEDPKWPSCFVVNTDPHYKAGTHWVAVFIDSSGNADYFDSFGRDPDSPFILQWLEKNCHSYTSNSACIQSYMAATCGQHCIYYLLMRCKGFPPNLIIYMTDSNFINDAFVTAYVNKYCNMKSKVFEEYLVIEQLCVAFGINKL